MGDPFASQEHDFDDLMRDAERLRKQVDTAKARVNSAAAVLAEKQLEYDNSEGELRDLKARLDRTRTQLVAIIDEKTDYDPAIAPAPAPVRVPAPTPTSLPPNVPQVHQLKSKRAASHLFEKPDYNVDDEQEDDDGDEALPKKRHGINANNGEKYRVIHPAFPTIIFINSAWNEVRCGICGANAGVISGKFLKGFCGFSAHMQKTHYPPGSKIPVLTNLHMRVITEDEEAALKRGKQPESKRIKLRFGKNHASSSATFRRESEGAKLRRFSTSDQGQDNAMAGRPFERYVQRIA